MAGCVAPSMAAISPTNRPLPQTLALHRADGYIQILGSGQDTIAASRTRALLHLLALG